MINNMNDDQSVGVEDEMEAVTYMRIVRGQIAEQMWLNRRGSRHQNYNLF